MDLDDATCDSLWELRNTVFARHGYPFDTGRAHEVFHSYCWYTPSDRPADAIATEDLTAADHANVEKLLAAETSLGCR